MRILHIMAGAQAGGAETMMLDGVLALAEAGVGQHVVTRDNDPVRIAALQTAGVPISIAPFDRIWRGPTRAKIKAAVRALQPDVQHFWMGRAGQFALEKHTAQNLGWYGGYYKTSRFKHCAWHAGVTKDITRAIIAQGVPESRATTLHTFANITTAPAVDRNTLNTPDDAPVVLALARLHWKKGLDTLLDALANLPGVYGWIAGSGPLEQDLRAQAERLGIANRVRFLGWRTDRAALLAACDVVAFPSRYEPFGTVTVEAWAAGKPLVVADSAGPAATVTPDVDAVLTPKDDVAALRAGIKRVLEDAAFAQSLIANGKRVYEARFTKQAFVRNALALYEKIIAAARAV
jgi:glycosyltransferase involved in cell wall biosynthesis